MMYMPLFISEQGLQFVYKYYLIRESQKETRASFGRIKADVLLFLRNRCGSIQINPAVATQQCEMK